jgi:zinc transporter ZupT
VRSGDTWKYVRHSTGGFYGAAELALHSFIDGFSIGIGFHFDFQIGIVVALAVILHDFPDGMNTVTVMLNSGNSLKSSMRMLMLDAVAPVIGAIASIFIRSLDHYLVYLLPFFAGGFLYLGASDLLPEAHEEISPAIAFIISVVGFLAVFLATRFIKF